MHDVRLYQMGDTLEQGKFGRPKILSHYCPKKMGVLGPRGGLKLLEFNVIASDGCSPEKAGVGGSIPSLATRLSSLKSTLADLFPRLCQICAVD